MTDPYLNINEVPALWAAMLTFARSMAKQPGVDAQKLLDDITDNAVWFSSWAEGRILDEAEQAYAMRIGQLLRALMPQQATQIGAFHNHRDDLPAVAE